MAGEVRRITLHACRHGERQYAVSWFDVAGPAEIDNVMKAWLLAAKVNVDAGEFIALPVKARGDIGGRVAARWQWAGKLPDGRPVWQQVAVLTQGLRVYQTSFTSAEVDPSRAERFFDSLRWAP